MPVTASDDVPDEIRDALTPLVTDEAEVARISRLLAWRLVPRRTAEVLRRAAAETGEAVPGLALDVALDQLLPRFPVASVRAVLAVVRAWASLGVRLVTPAASGYPPRLGAGWPHTDGPSLLAWRGELPSRRPVVSIVGARRATGYGTGVAAWLAEAVADAGATVVSGGAVGIDAAAHLAALERPGGTAVVLGCGHAVRYPRPHAGPGGLFERIVRHGGGVLSELLPHEQPHAGNVRARNRIVAGLADAVVVVEGGARSGALLTATSALDRSIPVLAVPGDVRAPGSAAPHRLLAEGAAPCSSPADLLDALGQVGTADEGAAQPPLPTVTVLPDDVHALLAAAWPRPLPVDDLAVATGRPAASLLGTLTRARIAGETADDASGIRLRRAPG